ncbi:MAG: HNH endonuclease [Planctomycetes bacterium]|nr:HNH endonuclease [Planctomycetota bacterium]
MIAPDHEEQIERLLREHFGDLATGLAWLEKDFDAQSPRDLLTAKRAGEVIYVLKAMMERPTERDAGDLHVKDWSYVIPMCPHCARTFGGADPSIISSDMGDDWLRAELGLEEGDEIAESMECFYCKSILDLEYGFSVTSVSAAHVHNQRVPNAARGSRIRPALRDYLRKRDRRTCQVCDRVLKLDKITMHHVKANSKGGETSPENLVVACEECQQRIGATEVPRIGYCNTEFVRELSAGEMETISVITNTPEEMEEHLQALLETMRGFRSGGPAPDGAADSEF